MAGMIDEEYLRHADTMDWRAEPEEPGFVMLSVRYGDVVRGWLVPNSVIEQAWIVKVDP